MENCFGGIRKQMVERESLSKYLTSILFLVFFSRKSDSWNNSPIVFHYNSLRGRNLEQVLALPLLLLTLVVGVVVADNVAGAGGVGVGSVDAGATCGFYPKSSAMSFSLEKNSLSTKRFTIIDGAKEARHLNEWMEVENEMSFLEILCRPGSKKISSNVSPGLTKTNPFPKNLDIFFRTL